MNRTRRYLELARIFLIRSGYKRANYLKKKRYFAHQGNNCYFQIWNFGTEPENLSFGNNCHIASGVTFISHDITAQMFKLMDNNSTYVNRRGDIKLGNNVFVGSNSSILYDVCIGDNVIIGAGSVVNKDIPSGSVAAGVPCKVIGSFDEYKEKIVNRRE